MSDKYLPVPKYAVTETIKGKKVKKQFYTDGSYGIVEGETVTRYFSDGKNQVYSLKSANEFGDNIFVLTSEVLPDGTVHRWLIDGRMKYEKLPDGTIRTWYENGQMEMEKLPDGTQREWYADGKMSKAKLPDNTLLEWDHYKKAFGVGGRLKNEKINRILMREWHDNGLLAYARSPGGKEIKYDRLGKVIYHATKGKEDTEEYLAKMRSARRQERMKELLKQGDSDEVAEKQLDMVEKLRQRAVARSVEKALLASRLERDDKNSDDIKDRDNLKVSQTFSNDEITENVMIDSLETSEIDQTEPADNS